nr:hypothetical protein Iba_chr07cCG14830 [Ipomoea batatas]
MITVAVVFGRDGGQSAVDATLNFHFRPWRPHVGFNGARGAVEEAASGGRLRNEREFHRLELSSNTYDSIPADFPRSLRRSEVPIFLVVSPVVVLEGIRQSLRSDGGGGAKPEVVKPCSALIGSLCALFRSSDLDMDSERFSRTEKRRVQQASWGSREGNPSFMEPLWAGLDALHGNKPSFITSLGGAWCLHGQKPLLHNLFWAGARCPATTTNPSFITSLGPGLGAFTTDTPLPSKLLWAPGLGALTANNPPSITSLAGAQCLHGTNPPS